MQEIKRLRWQCRRGMLEVDLILMRYLERRYVQASGAEQACFERLLQESDQRLFDWLMGKVEPDLPFKGMIDILVGETS